MASIRRHPASPTRWQVRYRDPSGRQRTKNFAKRPDAERFKATVEADKIRGHWTDPQLARTRFGDWWTHFLDSKLDLKDSTRARNESLGRIMLLPRFATVALGAIDQMAIRRWVADQTRAGYSPATIRKAYQLLSAALGMAVENGMIPRSPARNIPLPRNERKQMRFLTPSEVAELAEAIDPRYRALVLTAAYTGLRLGELTGLRVENVDFLRRRLLVERTLTEVGGRLRISEPKTAGSRRTILLPQFLVEVLAAHVATYPSPEGFVFTAGDGGPIRQTNFRSRHWTPAVRRSVGEPCRFHDLRHTHAALLIGQGVHPKVIQSRLGHSSITTTLDTYGHLFEGLDGAAADRLDQVFDGVRVDKLWTSTGA